MINFLKRSILFCLCIINLYSWCMQRIKTPNRQISDIFVKKLLTLNISESAKYLQTLASSGLCDDINFLLSTKLIEQKIDLLHRLQSYDYKEFRGHTKEVAAAIFSKDYKQIISGGADGKIIVWDSITGK